MWTQSRGWFAVAIPAPESYKAMAQQITSVVLAYLSPSQTLSLRFRQHANGACPPTVNTAYITLIRKSFAQDKISPIGPQIQSLRDRLRAVS
jgi:hypothetical protein